MSGWFNVGLSCVSIDQVIHDKLMDKNEKTGRLLYHTISNIEKY